MLIPDIHQILRDHQRITPHVHKTPVLESRAINEIVGASILFKCENLQRVGAFKVRGAFNAVLKLADNVAQAGVVTHSSGNHAAAVALAARVRGIDAYVVMPKTAPNVKKAAVKAYGAKILECEPTLAAREALTEQVAKDTGATFIAPFNDSDVIAGQATAFVELWEQSERTLDAVTCPVGGGGLLAGTAIAAKALASTIRVVAAEPEMADDAAVGFRQKTMQPQRLPVQTVADGLTTSMGDLTFAAMCQHVDDVVTVSEAAIIEAMRLIWTRMKLVIEPSSAVPLAAMLERRWDFADKKVGLILTGGNVDLDALPWR